MQRGTHGPALTLALVALLLACKQGKEDENATAAASAAASGNPSTIAEKVTDTAAAKAAKYGKTISKKGCELLTPESVAKTFEVPADALKQMKIMGCIYSWSEGDQTLEARVSMIMSHDSETAATTWFGNATRNKIVS